MSDMWKHCESKRSEVRSVVNEQLKKFSRSYCCHFGKRGTVKKAAENEFPTHFAQITALS